MTAPVIGPITRVQDNALERAGSRYVRRVGYTQSLPFDLVLPYDVRESDTLTARKWGGSNIGVQALASASHEPWYSYAQYYEIGYHPAVTEALNKSRAKLSSLVADSAQMLVNLAERKQAMEMIGNRLLQVYKVFRSLKRLDLAGAARTLGVTRDPRYLEMQRGQKLRTRSKELSNLWLEFHFGWEPLVRDIEAAMSLLDSPPEPRPIVGRGVVKGSRAHRQVTDHGTWTGVVNGKHDFKITAKCGALVILDNPNTFLASRLGFTNPGTVIWELVPWSFIVDWFVNVGDYINQFTEFGGLRFIMPYHSVKSVCYGEYSNEGGIVPSGVVITSRRSSFQRRVGLPDIGLVIRAPWQISKARAATAISLLIQQGIR